METKKECFTCGELKPLSAFWKMAQSRDGLRPSCAECTRNRREALRRMGPAERAAALAAPPVDVPDKRCSVCGETKPKDAFGLAARSRDGKSGECRVCASNRRRAYRSANSDLVVAKRRQRYMQDPAKAVAQTRRWVDENREHSREYRLHRRMFHYGLTVEGYDAMLAAQGGGCAICGDKPEAGKPRFPVDHDHSCCATERRSCGKCVRGILCPMCNRLLGRFERHRERFIDYTEKKEA